MIVEHGSPLFTNLTEVGPSSNDSITTADTHTVLTRHYFCLSTGIVRISQRPIVLFSLSCCECILHGLAFCFCWRPGPWFNIKMSSYQYRKSHCGDKTVVRSSYLHNGISYTGKMTSLYWFGPQPETRSNLPVLLNNMKTHSAQSTVIKFAMVTNK